MENTTAVVQSHGTSPYVDDLELSALTPEGMVKAQNDLIDWCDSKMAILRHDAKELKDATDHAKRCKWKWQVHDRHHKLTLKRIDYYKKIKSALIAGYYIIPNFPVDLFAIRTDSDKPRQYIAWEAWRNGWGSKNGYAQTPTGIPENTGEYKNPIPTIEKVITHKVEGTDGKTIEKNLYRAGEWQEIEFPANMAKPIIMQATESAMALKIFDRFGVMPSTKRKADPIIIGQIVFRTNEYLERTVSFMVAWHLNTNVL